MTTAVTLAKAAGLAWDNANVHWLGVGGSLKTVLTNFCAFALPSFGESDPNSHPVSNWLTILSNQADLMDASNVPIDQMAAATRSVYGVCWMGQFLQTAGLITSSQAADLLAAYNATLGLP